MGDKYRHNGIYYETARYKYRLIIPYRVNVQEFSGESFGSVTDSWLYMRDGLLSIKQHYSWDGPSGPTIDTKDTMRASLVHDALYQALRLGLVPQQRRKNADKAFYRILREDGMSRVRAWYYYRGVRFFGSPFARHKEGRYETTFG